MGTNYYVRPAGSTSDSTDDWIHLGKSSAGWTFTFRAYPDPAKAPAAVTEPVTDFGSWAKLLDLGDVFNEYHLDISKEEMLKRAKDRAGAVHGWQALTGQWKDDRGFRFDPHEFF